MWRKFWKIVSGPFYVLGSVASIVSILILCFKSSDAAIAALGFLCVALVAFIWKLFSVLGRFLERTTENHKHISSFIQYTCDDRDNIVLESYKLIQVKCSVMQEYEAGFKWSGTKAPDISSDLQHFKIVNKSSGGHLYDYAVLEFKKPVLYNETTVVHSKFTINDVDHKSSTQIDIPVKYPVEYIQVCVSLGYKDNTFNKTATLSKRKLANENEVYQEYTPYDSLSFDHLHKQYTCKLIDPEVGFAYRIEWER